MALHTSLSHWTGQSPLPSVCAFCVYHDRLCNAVSCACVRTCHGEMSPWSIKAAPSATCVPGSLARCPLVADSREKSMRRGELAPGGQEESQGAAGSRAPEQPASISAVAPALPRRSGLVWGPTASISTSPKWEGCRPASSHRATTWIK